MSALPQQVRATAIRGDRSPAKAAAHRGRPAIGQDGIGIEALQARDEKNQDNGRIGGLNCWWTQGGNATSVDCQHVSAIAWIAIGAGNERIMGGCFWGIGSIRRRVVVKEQNGSEPLETI
jgi:hypothetical protein